MSKHSTMVYKALGTMPSLFPSPKRPSPGILEPLIFLQPWLISSSLILLEVTRNLF